MATQGEGKDGQALPRPSALLALPNEIKIEIAEYLCPHCLESSDDAPDLQPTLSALSKTCKAWRSVAQPVLFHQFTCKTAPVDIKGTIELAEIFTRTLSERPDLGARVQALNCPFHDSLCVATKLLTAEEVFLELRRISSSHGLTITEASTEPLESLTQALASLLLKHTPNIKHLEADLFSVKQASASGHTSSPGRLESLSIRKASNTGLLKLRDILSSPWMSNLRSLNLHDFNVRLSLQGFPVLLPSLRRLAITGWSRFVEPTDVLQLLRAFPGVEDILLTYLYPYGGGTLR